MMTQKQTADSAIELINLLKERTGLSFIHEAVSYGKEVQDYDGTLYAFEEWIKVKDADTGAPYWMVAKNEDGLETYPINDEDETILIYGNMGLQKTIEITFPTRKEAIDFLYVTPNRYKVQSFYGRIENHTGDCYTLEEFERCS